VEIFTDGAITDFMVAELLYHYHLLLNFRSATIVEFYQGGSFHGHDNQVATWDQRVVVTGLMLPPVSGNYLYQVPND